MLPQAARPPRREETRKRRREGTHLGATRRDHAVQEELKKEPEKKAPPAPEKRQDPLFQATPRNFRVGGDIRPTRDLSRFVNGLDTSASSASARSSRSASRSRRPCSR